MYSSDSAIKTKADDLLGRVGFASELANAILKNTGEESIVVGLYGSWGCGKTSLVNLVIEEIESITNQQDDKPLIVNFDPWSFSSEENLVSAYFKTLRLSLNIEKNKAWKESIGEALDSYADAWDALNFIPGAGPILAPALKAVTRAGGKKLSKVKPIDKAKLSIEKAMLKRDQKIIVIIDDIDRLDNSQIRAVFQLVKQIASFPNTTFILPMAREVVVRALKDVQGDDGNTYLEKIVQIPFVIPELSNTKMQTVFFDKLDAVLRANSITTIDKKYWNSVFSGCVWPFIKNLRDVNRVINTIEFKINFLRGEICIEDLIAMTTIDVLEPMLFSWIGENRDSLCGNSRYIYYSHREKNSNKTRERYEQSLKDTGIREIDRSIIAIATLFPHFANEIELHLPYETGDNIKKDMRIAELKRATLFFDMDKDNIEISRKVIIDSIKTYPQKAYGDFLDDINNGGNILFYLDEITALLDEIPYDRLSMIIKEIWKRRTRLIGVSSVSFVVVSASWKSEVVVGKLIEKLKTPQERYDLFSDFLKDADINDMESIGEKINQIELAYGRLAGKGQERKQYQIIELQQLIDLESEYAQKAKQIAEDGDLFLGQSLIYFSYLWESFDKKEFSRFIKKHLKDDIFMLRFICRLAGKWTGSEGEGWSYNSSYYSEYITDEDIYTRINSYDKKVIKKDFDNDELVRIASFCLNYGKKDMSDHATTKEAEELINSWG